MRRGGKRDQENVLNKDMLGLWYVLVESNIAMGLGVHAKGFMLFQSKFQTIESLQLPVKKDRDKTLFL